MPYLPREATTEARDLFATYLRVRAEDQSCGSRDFGRGYMHAIEVLARAHTACRQCKLPPGKQGDRVMCPKCGLEWRLHPDGVTGQIIGIPEFLPSP